MVNQTKLTFCRPLYAPSYWHYSSICSHSSLGYNCTSHFLMLLVLQKNQKANRTAVSDDNEDGDLSEMTYRLLGSSDNYHLLEVHLHTGRHHQIRAQLAAIGSPIKGDVKYGARRGNRDRSIHLHAWKLGFEHPISGERVELMAALPDDPVWKAFEEILASQNTGNQ